MNRLASSPTALPVHRPVRVEQPRRAFVAQLMGLPVSIHVRGPHAADTAVAAQVQLAFVALAADDTTFSTYRSDSTVSAIQRGERPLHLAGSRVRDVAALCEEAARRTNGSFCAWRPDAHGRRTFEPSGLVKGWAVEQAFDALCAGLAEFGPHDVLVNAGGDIVVRCARSDTPDWRVGVEDPRHRSRMLRVVELRTGAVATSGTAARGSHIVDPVTGAPAGGLLSATVTGPSLLWADVYATAAFVDGPAAADWLHRFPGYAAELVGLDGTTTRIRAH